MASPRGGSTGRRTSRASAVTMEAWLVIEGSTALPPFEVVNFVAKQREGDPTAVRLSFREGFGHVKGLFRFHARRHRWLKWIGSSDTPYSGLPRNTICSHLIIPSVLFLMMTTLIGSRYFTAVANSPMSIVKPPSPTNATD